MHDWISTAVLDRFAKILSEHQTYEIQNFSVEAYTAQNKCFYSSKHIILTDVTTDIHLPGFHCHIAESIFGFTNLKRIQELKVEDNYLIGKLWDS